LGGLAAVAAATLILFTQLLSFLLDESVPSTPVVVITFAIGWVLFALASLRARVLPRGGAILLIAGGVIGFGLVIFPRAGILLALAVGWMGFSLRQADL
jgi:hypothetical protein